MDEPVTYHATVHASGDNELDMLNAVFQLLQHVDDEQRARIVGYLHARCT